MNRKAKFYLGNSYFGNLVLFRIYDLVLRILIRKSEVDYD